MHHFLFFLVPFIAGCITGAILIRFAAYGAFKNSVIEEDACQPVSGTEGLWNDETNISKPSKQIMKTLTSLFIALILCTSIQAQKPFVNVEAGYVNDHYAQFSMSAGVTTKSEDSHFYNYLEVAGKFHLSEDQKTDVAGINYGIGYNNKNFFASLKAGPAVGFNREVKDEYVKDGVTTLLSDGYATSAFVTCAAGARIGTYIFSKPVYMDCTIAGKQKWFGAGIEINF
jgi:hypothetical protein